MKAKLPHFLKFRTASDLIRIGREYDGGYLVSAADLERSDYLISVGMADDWSFEAEFLTKRKVPVNI